MTLNRPLRAGAAIIGASPSQRNETVCVKAATGFAPACDNRPAKAYKLAHGTPGRWNMTHAAEQLGISRNTLYRKIKLFGIPLPHARRS
jgi:transcriptional regulator of acetoin/glycerol metabolism